MKTLCLWRSSLLVGRATATAKNTRTMTPVDMDAIQDPPFGAFIAYEEKQWVHVVEVILGIHADQKLTKSDYWHPARRPHLSVVHPW